MKIKLLFLCSFLFLSCNSTNENKNLADEFITSVNKNEILKSLIDDNCKIIINNELSYQKGIIPLLNGIKVIVKNEKSNINLYNTILKNNQIVTEWKTTEEDTIRDKGVMIFKTFNGKINEVKFFYNNTNQLLSLNSEELADCSNAPNAKYWFYVRTSTGGYYNPKGFYYSQILKCCQPVSTPGIFGKKNAVGPFNTYAEASTARKDEILIAQTTELTLRPRQAICETKWE